MDDVGSTRANPIISDISIPAYLVRHVGKELEWENCFRWSINIEIVTRSRILLCGPKPTSDERTIDENP
jgi:hypothetical protein